jgi:DNA-binding NarL/FixJ family response regulator
MNIRLILADDHRIMREGLRALVERLPGMEVIGEAADGRTTVAMAKELSPEVVVMDIGLPDLNGIEATRQIASQNRNIKVIALSMHSDCRYVAKMLKAGASGYLLKDSAFEELARAIRAVAAGKTYLSPAVAGAVVKDYLGRRPDIRPALASLLTAREREVLQLVAEGKSTKEIAEQLQISPKTADTHRQQIMRKLELRSVAELTKWAVREGITEP